MKTDGLAAGKGVVVTESLADARDAVRAYLSGEAFGDAGRTLVIEEGLTGPELSLLVVCNGDPDAAIPLAPAQDFKRIARGRRRPQHRRHGRVLAGADRRATRRRRRRDGARGATHAALARRPRRRLPRRALRRDDAHRRRPEGHRVQRALRRPECQVVLPRVTSDVAELLRAAAAGEKLDGHVLRRRVRDRRARQPTATPRHRAPATPSTASTSPPARQHGHRVPRRHHPRRPRRRSRTAGGRVLDVTATGVDLEVARTPRLRGGGGMISWQGHAATGATSPQAAARGGAPSTERRRSSANPAPGPHPGDDEGAGDAPQRPTVLRRRDEAHGAPVLAAVVARRDGVLVPVLRAVHHPRSTSSPVLARPDRLRSVPDRGPFRAIPGS